MSRDLRPDERNALLALGYRVERNAIGNEIARPPVKGT